MLSFICVGACFCGLGDTFRLHNHDYFLLLNIKLHCITRGKKGEKKEGEERNKDREKRKKGREKELAREQR